MSLQDPAVKMSKSDEHEMAAVFLTDDDDTIRKKIMRAVTDSSAGVAYDSEKKPAIANLMTIYHHMTGQTMKEIEMAFAGKGYGDFKKALAEAVIQHVGPIRAKIQSYLADPTELNKILDAGRDKAMVVAEAKMKIVREKMGLGR